MHPLLAPRFVHTTHTQSHTKKSKVMHLRIMEESTHLISLPSANNSLRGVTPPECCIANSPTKTPKSLRNKNACEIYRDDIYPANYCNCRCCFRQLLFPRQLISSIWHPPYYIYNGIFLIKFASEEMQSKRAVYLHSTSLKSSTVLI